MPNINVDVPERIADALDRQARSLLLRRRSFVRAILAAVAAEAESPREEDAQRRDDASRGEVGPDAQR